MSGIVGIFNLDGQPVDADLVSRMTHAIRHRGPDGSGEWVDGSVALGQTMFHTTPESLAEKLPLTDETNQICLTLDGRVDNRKELRRALVAKGAKLRNDTDQKDACPTDSELVLRAYECWDESCVERILGDWAFVIWDKHRHRLFMARDPIGIRPLLYWFNGSLLLVASEPKLIFEHPVPQRKVNWPVLGDYLCNNWTEHEETLYVGVKRLPAGHVAVAQNGTFRMRRYWPVDLRQEIHYRRHEEYAEHFLSLFEKAVRCRLRSTTPVGVLLSGGLDSSSIASTAQMILRKEPASYPGFETLSVVYPGFDCDESFYIDAVARELDVLSHRIVYGGHSNSSPLLERARDFPDVLYSPATMSNIFLYSQYAHNRGIRVLLDGIGGDELFSFRPWWYLPDALRDGNFNLFYHQLRHTQTELGEPIGQIILRHAIWPLLPNSVKKTIRWLRSQVSRVEEIAVEPWIDSDFAIRHHLKERLNRRQIPTFLPIRSVSKQLLYNLFTASYNMIFALEFNNRVMSRLSLEKRHPFLDRRLLDFCLAIPEQERLGDGINKFLLRKALHGILPKAIEQRKFKVIFDSLQNEEINVRHANSVNRLFENLRLEADGVLKRGEAHRLLTEFRQGNTRAAGPVDAILFLELWYRNH